eukprot:CAMPEP_0194302682 /NCGR_PEP_ID=MMETSP0171-20130528/545_1 /TAXON_ID=218684 /ORGANISM="Corethron pennatum, Strain L29A3" /LENGTH=37 /DNA_ID= /DNA_START= /DNA_END= /DNA_ORIENTATION=
MDSQYRLLPLPADALSPYRSRAPDGYEGLESPGTVTF